MAVGAVATVVALVAALLLPLEPHESRSRRAGRFVAGPGACVVVGTLMIYFSDGKPSPENMHTVEVLDNWWFLYPILGVIVGACVFLTIGRKKARPS
jgi:hypothetical protein